MAVEDHHMYEQWSEALDRLKEANDCYRAAVSSGHPPKTIEALKSYLDLAQSKFNEIADQIDS